MRTDEEGMTAARFEARIKRLPPPVHCPVCTTPATIEQNAHHIDTGVGVQTVIEHEWVECPKCWEVHDCKRCRGNVSRALEAGEHREMDDIDLNVLCYCPWEVYDGQKNSLTDTWPGVAGVRGEGGEAQEVGDLDF